MGQTNCCAHFVFVTVVVSRSQSLHQGCVAGNLPNFQKVGPDMSPLGVVNINDAINGIGGGPIGGGGPVGGGGDIGGHIGGGRHIGGCGHIGGGGLGIGDGGRGIGGGVSSDGRRIPHIPGSVVHANSVKMDFQKAALDLCVFGALGCAPIHVFGAGCLLGGGAAGMGLTGMAFTGTPPSVSYSASVSSSGKNLST